MSISVLDMHLSPDSAALFPAQESGSLLYVDDSVRVSADDMRSHAEGDLSEAVFFSYARMHEILGEAEIDLGRREEEADDDQLEGRRLVLNSKVVSASLGGRAGRHQELLRPVEVRLRHLRQNDSASSPRRCVYWDLERLSWSGSGCVVAASSPEETVCRCGHLAAFAVVVPEEAGEAGADGVGEKALGGVLGR